MFKKFDSVKIAVIGDVILDHYLEGDVNRISPEAPVPVVNFQKEYYRLGGAANVFYNLRDLGVDAKLFSVIGKDQIAQELIHLLKKIARTDNIADSILLSEKRKTILKTRVTAGKQQLLRIDREETTPVDISLIQELLEKFKITDFDGVIFSDYNKGMFSTESFKLFNKTILKQNTFTVLDPKPNNQGEERNFYQNFSVMTPNHHESAKLVGEKTTNDKKEIIRIGKKIIRQYNLKHLLITRGEKGIVLFEDTENYHFIPAQTRSVFDVSGAGDTISAVFTACYLNRFSLKQSVEIANIAAGEVVAKFGTSSVSFKELYEVLKNYSNN